MSHMNEPTQPALMKAALPLRNAVDKTPGARAAQG